MSADRHGAQFVNIYFRKHQKQIEIHIHLSKFDGFTVTMLLRLAELMEYHLAEDFNCIPKIIRLYSNIYSNIHFTLIWFISCVMAHEVSFV